MNAVPQSQTLAAKAAAAGDSSLRRAPPCAKVFPEDDSARSSHTQACRSNIAQRSAFVIDPSPLWRAALTQVLQEEFAFGEVLGGGDAKPLAFVGAPSLFVLIVDSCLIGGESDSAIADLRAAFGEVRIVVMAAQIDVAVSRRWLDRGASAVLDKRLERAEVCAALRDVFRGETVLALASQCEARARDEFGDASISVAKLRPRQKEVLRLVGRGLKHRDIARTLNLCLPTVRHHVRGAMQALQLKNRTNAAICARWLSARGLI